MFVSHLLSGSYRFKSSLNPEMSRSGSAACPTSGLWFVIRTVSAMAAPCALIVVALLSSPASIRAQRQVATVDEATGPGPVAVNPVTNRIYVARLAASTIDVIDGATNISVGTVASPVPVALAVNSVTNTIYIANGEANEVTVLDGGTNTVSTTISVGVNPRSVAVNPVTNMIYVANFGDNTVSVIDGVTNAVVVTLAVGSTPQFIGVNPVTNRIYVVNTGDATVSVIDGGASPATVVGTE
jgi:YVTN family beta-propeller protein